MSYGLNMRFLNEQSMKLISLFSNFQIRDLLLISFALHLFVIGFPSDGGKIFDETFYVPTANDILKLVPSNPEHPFLGKVWGSIGILIFGNNSFGWRIPIVAFGLLTLYVFYHFAKLHIDERKALIATAFLSVDTIFFIHSSILMLEVPALFFAILGFYLYFKNRYLLCAVSFGVSILSKEWSILFLLGLLIYHLAQRMPRSRSAVNRAMFVKTGKFVGVLIVVVLVPLWIYSATFQPPTSVEVQVIVTTYVDEKGNPIATSTTTTTIPRGQISNPFDQLKYILTYQSSLVIKEDSKPQFWNNYAWGWIIPFDVKPPLYFENTVKTEIVTKAGDEIIKKETIEKHPISWKGIGNFPIWLSIWPITFFSATNIITRKASKLDYLIIAWIVATFFSWFYVSGVTHRIVYAFYFINVVPILALGIPHFISGISKGNLTTLPPSSFYIIFRLMFSILVKNLYHMH